MNLPLAMEGRWPNTSIVLQKYCYKRLVCFQLQRITKDCRGGGGGLDNCFGNLSRHDAKLFKMIRKIGRVASVTDCVKKFLNFTLKLIVNGT